MRYRKSWQMLLERSPAATEKQDVKIWHTKAIGLSSPSFCYCCYSVVGGGNPRKTAKNMQIYLKVKDGSSIETLTHEGEKIKLSPFKSNLKYMLTLTKPLHSALKNIFCKLPFSREIIRPTVAIFTVKLVHTCVGILVIKIFLLHVASNNRGY